MGMSFKGMELGKEYARKDIFEIEPELVVPSPDCNGRHVKPDRTETWADMDRNGQHTPCEIKKENGVPVLYAGYGRWEWCIDYNKREKTHADKEGRKPIYRKLICTHFSGDALSAFCHTIAENRFRNATTELDDAFNIRRFIDVLTQTPEQVSEIYFPGRLAAKFPNDEYKTHDEALKDSVKWVKKMYGKGQKLAGASPALLKEIKAGRVEMPAALHVAQLDEARQRSIIERAKESGNKIDTPRAAEGPKTPNLKTLLVSIDAMNGPGVSKEVQSFIAAVMDYASGKTNKIVLKEVG